MTIGSRGRGSAVEKREDLDLNLCEECDTILRLKG